MKYFHLSILFILFSQSSFAHLSVSPREYNYGENELNKLVRKKFQIRYLADINEQGPGLLHVTRSSCHRDFKIRSGATTIIFDINQYLRIGFKPSSSGVKTCDIHLRVGSSAPVILELTGSGK